MSADDFGVALRPSVVTYGIHTCVEEEVVEEVEVCTPPPPPFDLSHLGLQGGRDLIGPLTFSSTRVRRLVAAAL